MTASSISENFRASTTLRLRMMRISSRRSFSSAAASNAGAAASCSWNFRNSVPASAGLRRNFSKPSSSYSSASSDVYQDLFGWGTFTGKGIYDLDTFETALDDKVADNTLLSHDLFEGIFVRAALASDIELFEHMPSDYATYSKRQHRWIRGDWQIAPWVAGSVPSANGGRVRAGPGRSGRDRKPR